MICRNCGNKLEKSANFCNKCGKSLTSFNRKKSNKIIIIFVILVFMLSISYYGYNIVMKKNEEAKLNEERIAKLNEEKQAKINELIEDIKSHYSNNVIVSKDTDLIDDKGNVVGTVYKNSAIKLNDIDINENTKYFSIENLNYNIDYKSVMKNDNNSEKIRKLSKEKRYKHYIPYNKNLVTKDVYSLYYKGNKVYTFNRSDTYPIIINNYEDYYYVEFNNKLYSINKNDIKEIVYNDNTTKKNKSYITTLCYHRIYDTNDNCSSSALCIKKENFDTQMKYLKDNDYFTLTSEEMYMYISGNLQIEKGVFVTLDDGWLLAGAIEVFDKYDLNGVSFTATYRIEDGSFSLEKTYNSDNIEVQSHTHNMHRNWVCSKSLSKIGSSSQGGAILCEKEEDIVNDLKKSITIIDDLGKNKTIALAYPFYDFNDRAITLIKKSGLKMAFTGAYSKKGRAVVGNDPYIIPRIPIRATTSFSSFKNYL